MNERTERCSWSMLGADWKYQPSCDVCEHVPGSDIGDDELCLAVLVPRWSIGSFCSAGDGGRGVKQCAAITRSDYFRLRVILLMSNVL